MKTPIDPTGSPGSLLALLNSGSDVQTADLWEITLSGGAVIRWSGAQVPLTFNGVTYALGPLIERGKLTVKLGLEAATIEATISANASDLINGVPILPFAIGRGFDGATVRLFKAYLPAWGQPIAGCLLNFSGRVTQIKDASRVGFTMVISSWTILLNVSMGPDVFQAGCLNTHYDADCGLTPSPVSGSISSGATVNGFGTNLTQADGFFSRGLITFTSGANNGLRRAIGTYTHSGGAMTVAFPLPSAPAPGDTFTASRGCLLTMADCSAQGNLIHFRGQPFTPPAITGAAQ